MRNPLNLFLRYVPFSVKIWSLGKQMKTATNIAVWGAGGRGEYIIPLLKKEGYALRRLVDSNPAIRGDVVEGFTVESPDVLRSERADVVVVCAPAHFEEIGESLESMGYILDATYAEDSMVLAWPFFRENLRALRNRIRLFRRLVFAKRVAFFGAGDRARLIRSTLAAYAIEPTYYVDNNESRWGEDFMGKPIVSPQTLIDDPVDFVVVCVGGGFEELADQLTKLGLIEYRDFASYDVVVAHTFF